jgi:GYF domain 2
MNWWYVSGRERRGPVNEDELSRLFNDGSLTTSSLVWKSGMENWQLAADVSELQSFLSSLPPKVPTLPPELPTKEKRLWQRVNWRFVLIAFIAIQAITFVVAFIFGALHNPVGVVVSSLILTFAGLAVVGCITPKDRWVNIALVAFSCWISSLVMVPFGTTTLSRWALSVVWYAVFVGFAGVVSLLISALIKWSRPRQI